MMKRNKAMMVSILVYLFLCLVLQGCKSLGKQCFKFSGEYKGVEGGFEYCIEPTKSKIYKIPTLRGKDGKEHYIFSEDQIKRIVEKLKNKAKAKAKALSTYRIKPVQRLLILLGEEVRK